VRSCTLLFAAVLALVLFTPSRAHGDVRLSFDLENAPLVSQSRERRTDLAGFSSFTARAHMRIGRNGSISGGLGLSPIAAASLFVSYVLEDAVIFPDPIANLQVPVTFTYHFNGVGETGPYALAGGRFMIVPVLPCANQATLCPKSRADVFALGPAAEVGLGFQLSRGASWRASLSYVQARLSPLGDNATEPYNGVYHGVMLSLGGITDKIW
jgi:hypothetical protein